MNKAMTMTTKLDAKHGVVCRLSGERFGYFAWPTVARMDDGTLVVACSGLRTQHICPFGKTVLSVSRDDGATWSEPRVIQDSMIDDRDAGIVNLGGARLLVTWFRMDTRIRPLPTNALEEELRLWKESVAEWTDDRVAPLIGSWLMLSEDAGTTWSEPIRSPVTAPHGPIRLRNGDLLYLGKNYVTQSDWAVCRMLAVRSSDNGRSWKTVGQVPIADKTDPVNYHELHAVELPSGRILGMIRIQNHSGKTLDAAGLTEFSLMQTESDDGGCTWSAPRPLGFHGSPPHLLRHSSGVLVLTYGYRQAPFGQRVAFSHDDGKTWDHDWILRNDGPDWDLGYPATTELADGSLFSVYYQKAEPNEKGSILWSHWQLNEV
jgi:sialidase-1